jgi:hypothetical protein
MDLAKQRLLIDALPQAKVDICFVSETWLATADMA